MLYGSGPHSRRRIAMKLGVDDFVTKPFSPLALAAKLEELLDPGRVNVARAA